MTAKLTDCADVHVLRGSTYQHEGVHVRKGPQRTGLLLANFLGASVAYPDRWIAHFREAAHDSQQQHRSYKS